MARKTKSNTPPTYTRNGNVITASWVRQAQDFAIVGQQYDYRTMYGGVWGAWGGWKDIAWNTTSIPFTFPSMDGSMQAIEVMTRIRGCNSNYSYYAWSDPTSSAYYTYPPAVPSLSVTKDSANQTTFSWSLEVDEAGQNPFYTCYYSTYSITTGWSSWAPVGASGSLTYTDTATNFYRQFAIYSSGWGGNSAIAQALHYIGTPPAATWTSSPVSTSFRGSYYDMTYNINLAANEDQVDAMTPQYYIGKPTAAMACPSGVSWTDGTSRSFLASGPYALPITTTDIIDFDECLWARVKTEHDGLPAYSEEYRVLTGRLAAPTATFTMGSITTSGFSVTVNITDAGTSVPGAYVQVYLERASRGGMLERIGSIPNGTSSATISSPIDLTHETGLSIRICNVTADGHSMTSAFYSYTTSMPTAPTLNSVTADRKTPGKVFVSWTQNWAKANSTVIAWTDDPDNWMSNDAPDTYEVTESASGWYIVGLETGKTWHFRVRSVYTEDDSVTNTPWSNEKTVDLSSAPAIPVLYLSENTITEDGMVSAYWVYSTTDGTPQVAADIVQMTYANNRWSPVRTVTGVGSAQHVDIYAKNQGWQNGNKVYLSLRTRSGSGGQSDYSTPVPLVIAKKPTVSFSSTSLSNGRLTALPFSFTAATTSARELSIAIERMANYPMVRPDGTETAGAKGETIFVRTVRASLTNSFSINLADLIGSLDDGALYNLVATATDGYGQTAKAVTTFRVDWSRQAWVPEATIVTDQTNKIVRITPVATEDYAEGDTCDIYRLSIDGAELIYSGAQFGTEYVDPYPAFGEFSGYRIVTITANGDYITEDNSFADYDTAEQGGYTPIDSKDIVIDFSGSRVELPYNITLSNSWAKDFKRTVYLGGHTTGDHNKTVTRDLSASSLFTRKYDADGIQQMRELSRFSGTCHVRTPDGSSFAADVQVSEDMAYNSAVADYSLTIQRVDPKGYEGMTYAEWSASQ